VHDADIEEHTKQVATKHTTYSLEKKTTCEESNFAENKALSMEGVHA